MDRQNDPQASIAEQAAAMQDHLVAIRRDLHAHPELGFQEVRTAGVVAAELRRLGIPCQTGIGQTGVVGTIQGGAPGPTVALRADMDALPIAEQTGLPYASGNPGLMHACGHDIHTTTLLGAAAVLQGMAPQLRGTIKLIFQPAEEIAGGAVAMMAEGVLDGVDQAIGFHNHPELPSGQFAYVPGVSLASVDIFDITVHGRSGHAAYPHQAIDPIVAACALVGQLQTVVSREVPPLQSAVVTVGAIAGGAAHNIIPDSCLVRGTVRTLNPATRDLAEQAIRRLCDGIATSLRVTCEIDFQRKTPPLPNDPATLARGVASIQHQLGDVIASVQPSMGGEDYAFMADAVPSFHFWVGSGTPGGEGGGLHNSKYQPDEACIEAGVAALSRIAVDMLS